MKDGKGTLYEWYSLGCYSICEYKNGLKNGKGKEFFKGSLVFEGEYVNGVKNGKGKKYEGHNLKFEGEYLYGYKRKGKDYINGILEFEGEYLFGKKWEGKGYDKNGNVIYELINGNGNIREYNIWNILIFEGDVINGKKNGKGKEYNYHEGYLIFEGEYLNDLRNGKGKEYDAKGNLIFEGKYLNGEKNNFE